MINVKEVRELARLREIQFLEENKDIIENILVRCEDKIKESVYERVSYVKMPIDKLYIEHIRKILEEKGFLCNIDYINDNHINLKIHW